MKIIWDYINQHSLPRKTKHTLFLLVNTILFAVVGYLFWLFAVRHVSKNWLWLFCSVGYSSFFLGYLGALFHLWKKD